MPQDTISTQVHGVLRKAVDMFRDQPDTADLLAQHREQLTEPLRIAVAGKAKAGKSTLLNALLGEELAATDAGECTKVITWYQRGTHPDIALHPVEGPAQSVPVIKKLGKLTIELDGMSPELLDRITVRWPSQYLSDMTLIDTPGIASASREISARTTSFLGSRGRATTADAVIYLMHHLHDEDARLLESFHDNGFSLIGSVSAIGVLSRADEIGGGRVDALLSARNIARRYSTNPAIRALCHSVMPVSGLLAQTGRTLQGREFAAIADLADAPRSDIESNLLSTDRFLRFPAGKPPGSCATPEVRSALLTRFGLFGLRLGITLVRQGCRDGSRLASELVRLSGLPELRTELSSRFSARAELLKAHSALMAMEAVAQKSTDPARKWLATEVERLTANAHELAELRLLAELRSHSFSLAAEVTAEAERLLGGNGSTPSERLGLAGNADNHDLCRAASTAITDWRRRAENPLTTRKTSELARMVVRSCEGLITTLRG